MRMLPAYTRDEDGEYYYYEEKQGGNWVQNDTQAMDVDDEWYVDLLVRFGAIPKYALSPWNDGENASALAACLWYVSGHGFFYDRKLTILPSCFLFTPLSPLSLLPQSTPELMHPSSSLHSRTSHSNIFWHITPLHCMHVLIQISLEAMWTIVLNRHMVSWSCSLLTYWSIQGRYQIHMYTYIPLFISLSILLLPNDPQE